MKRIRTVLIQSPRLKPAKLTSQPSSEKEFGAVASVQTWKLTVCVNELHDGSELLMPQRFERIPLESR